MRGTLSPNEDLYRTLQVEPSADLEAIHAAYRRLARLYHPDLNPRPDAAERMRAINAAYRVLSDAQRRAAYDAQRFLRPARLAVGVRPAAARAYPRQAVYAPQPPPTELQRRVDRIVAVLGVLLLIGIGLFAAIVIPRAEPRLPRDARSPNPTISVTGLPVASGPLPDRIRQDVGLRSFPGMVLVPPTTLSPFKDLPVMRIDATSQGIARYAVYYGDVTTGVAGVSGLIGRTSFDAAMPRIAGCAPDASYCAGPGVGQPASDPPGVEMFRPEHLVGEDQAFVIHRVCCTGVSWQLNWYDASANMSYTIDLSRNIALEFGDARAEDDVDAARAVGALASQLVRLP